MCFAIKLGLPIRTTNFLFSQFGFHIPWLKTESMAGTYSGTKRSLGWNLLDHLSPLLQYASSRWRNPRSLKQKTIPKPSMKQCQKIPWLGQKRQFPESSSYICLSEPHWLNIMVSTFVHFGCACVPVDPDRWRPGQQVKLVMGTASAQSRNVYTLALSNILLLKKVPVILVFPM